MKTSMLVILIAVLLIPLASLTYTAATSTRNTTNSNITTNEGQGDTQPTQYNSGHMNAENSRPEATYFIKNEQ